MMPAATASLRRMRGIGLIEIMIGMVVALITSLVIFQALSVSEGYRRTPSAAPTPVTTAASRSFHWSDSSLGQAAAWFARPECGVAE